MNFVKKLDVNVDIDRGSSWQWSSAHQHSGPWLGCGGQWYTFHASSPCSQQRQPVTKERCTDGIGSDKPDVQGTTQDTGLRVDGSNTSCLLEMSTQGSDNARPASPPYGPSLMQVAMHSTCPQEGIATISTDGMQALQEECSHQFCSTQAGRLLRMAMIPVITVTVKEESEDTHETKQYT